MTDHRRRAEDELRRDALLAKARSTTDPESVNDAVELMLNAALVRLRQVEEETFARAIEAVEGGTKKCSCGGYLCSGSCAIDALREEAAKK